ncbi:MAG: phosphonate metabolism protein/1,5-bisphosphokinase (PRPP-forming) PhnN [Aestuariivirga sp.]
MSTGRLVAVVGPSGAGKDSILRYAKQQFRNDERFAFPRRVVTRVADVATEDHDSVDVNGFNAMALSGAFALSWSAHGLKYGVAKEIEADLRCDRVVSINLSRTILTEAERRFVNLMVVEVLAAPDVIAARIASRGREVADEALERTRRSVPTYPSSLTVHRIRNDGSLVEAGEAFCALLESAAAVRA